MKREDLKNEIFEMMNEWTKKTYDEELHRLYATEDFAKALTEKFAEDGYKNQFMVFAQNVFIDLAREQVGNKKCKIWDDDYKEKIENYVFYELLGGESSRESERFQKLTTMIINATEFLKGEIK